MRRSGLIILWLALVTAPRLAAAAVVVAEPSGDADAAFLAELKASLESVATEAAPELNAELRARANVKEEGVEIIVELVLADGSDTIREARVASLASALPQARAMGRAALHELAAPPPPKVIVVKETTATPQPAPRQRRPALDSPYDKGRALWFSWGTTLGGMGLSTLILTVSMVRDSFGGVAMGFCLMGLSLSIGPSAGYFYMHDTARAVVGLVLRTAMTAASTATLVSFFYRADNEDAYINSCTDADDNWTCGENDFPDEELIISGSVLGGAMVIYAMIDLATVWHAAQRANERYQDGLHVTVAPVAWADGNGQRTFGLALNGSF